MVDVVGQLKDTLTNLLVSGVDIVEHGVIVNLCIFEVHTLLLNLP